MKEEKERPVDMVNNSNLGKWMSWSDIVHLYPDRWIYLTDFKLDSKSNIIGGVLRIVCREPEFSLVEDLMTDRSKPGYLHRTTELPGNILWVE
ncbi:MAG: hypothetical protein IJ679_10115 [Lachnospiraceae bacterium]|nr:hypothetical protein [Lachnospiraceae bacterium]